MAIAAVLDRLEAALVVPVVAAAAVVVVPMPMAAAVAVAVAVAAVAVVVVRTALEGNTEEALLLNAGVQFLQRSRFSLTRQNICQSMSKYAHIRAYMVLPLPHKKKTLPKKPPK